MVVGLTRFRVVGLHGCLTMDVHIDGDKLILVGENGTGKSTLANLIYFFLTKQWWRLHDHHFSAVEAVLCGEHLGVTPEQIESHFNEMREASLAVRRFSPRLTASVRSKLMHYWEEGLLEGDEQLVFKFSEEADVPIRLAREFIAEYSRKARGKPTELQPTEQRISSYAKGQFLYLHVQLDL